MTNMTAILHKQIKDTLKNKEILIQFVMFPVLTIIMKNAVSIPDMPENYFVTLFASMYIGMAPLVSMAAVIAEEKEKNTLKALMMSGVKPWEYFAGIGIYIWSACMLGALVFEMTGEYNGTAGIAFLGIMAVGILVSMLIGAAIGIASTSQMMATSLTVPVMLVFAFLPMLAAFNKTIEIIARAAYSQQINLLIGQVEHLSISFENVFVIGINMLAAFLCFGYSYKRCGQPSF